MRFLSVAFLVLAAGCLPKRAPGLAEHHDFAVADGDAALALAYDDELLRSSWLFPHEIDSVRADRRRDFERWVHQRLDEHGPMPPDDVAGHLGFLMALQAEGRKDPVERREDVAPVVQAVLRPRIREAAAILWKEVEAEAAAGRYAGAVSLGTAIAEAVPEEPAYASRLAELRADGARWHAALAKEVPAEWFSARVLHARLARQMGATEPLASAEDAAALAGLGTLRFALEVPTPCGVMPDTVSDLVVPAGTPGAARMVFSFDRCEVVPTLVEERKTLTYTVPTPRSEVVPVRKPQEVCKDIVRTEMVMNEWGHQVETPMDSGGTRVCSTEYVDTQELREWVEDVPHHEPYVEKRISAKAYASGRVTLSWDGRDTVVPFRLAGASTTDDVEFQTEHGPSAWFTGIAVEEARLPLILGIEKVGDDAVRLAQKSRAAAASRDAERALAEGRVAEAEHWWFVAAHHDRELSEGFLADAATRHGADAAVILGAVDDLPAPTARPWRGSAPALPAVPDAVMAVEEANNQRDLALWLREMIKYSFTVGGTHVLRPTEDAPPLYGATFGMAVTTDTRYYRVPSYGVLWRIGIGHDTSGTSWIDTDVAFGGGVHLWRFSVTPLVGVGLSAMGLPLNEPPREGSFPIGNAGFWEYGAKVGFVAGDRLLVDADVIYTKAFRAAGMAVEERVDTRLWIKNFVLGVRYSAFVEETDWSPVPFSADPAGSTVVVSVGGGFF